GARHRLPRAVQGGPRPRHGKGHPGRRGQVLSAGLLQPRDRRRDQMRLCAATYLLGLLVVGPPEVLAASFTLDPEQRSDALRVGARSVTQEVFDAEWRVANPSGDSLIVLTPFHRLVIAARQAAFKNEPLKPEEPEKLLKSRRTGW